jgi:hypothetical protein
VNTVAYGVWSLYQGPPPGTFHSSGIFISHSLTNLRKESQASEGNAMDAVERREYRAWT